MESNNQWIPAGEAVSLLEPTFEGAPLSAAYAAQMTICKRAHGGLIRARARRLIVERSRPRRSEKGTEVRNDYELPAEFWRDFAEGRQALPPNWTAGDFDTWTDGNTKQQALGVSFSRTDVETIIPAAPAAVSVASAGETEAAPEAAAWWNLVQCLIWIGERDLAAVNRAADLTGHLAAVAALHGSKRRIEHIEADPQGNLVGRPDHISRFHTLAAAAESGKICARGETGGIDREIAAWEWCSLDIAFPQYGLPELVKLKRPMTGPRPAAPVHAIEAAPIAAARCKSADMMAVWPAAAAAITIAMPAATGTFAPAMAPAADTQPKPRRGRRTGSGWERADKPLLDQMAELIGTGRARSAEDAARIVAANAPGAGTTESRRTRLAKRYREQQSISEDK